MRSSAFLFLLFLAFKTVCFSQEKPYRAPLPAVPEDGFYKIHLRPEIVAYCKTDLADLRLYDRKMQEVPYLTEQSIAEKTNRNFKQYPVIQKTSIPNERTTLVIQNPERTKIANIGLLIKNTGVRKKVRLSGSSDGKFWYALEDNYLLQAVANPEETAEVKVLQFPLSDYEFYKLEINDSASAPLNILAAGYYNFNAEKGQYDAVTGLQYVQVDSAAVKKTFLFFSAEKPVLIDKLEFAISSPTFYLRNATVFVKEISRGKRQQELVRWVPQHPFQLNSDGGNSIRFSGFRAREFYLEIENADDQPLAFAAIKAFQLKRFLVAELKKNHRYELQFGDEKSLKPRYDLRYFKDKLPLNPEVLEPLGIIQNATDSAPKSGLNQYFQRELLIWIALLLVIAFLGYMTYRMLQDQTTNP